MTGVFNRSQNCDKAGVIYSIQCNTCEVLVEDDRETSHYIGMTRTTLHNRMLGHLKDQRYKKSKSPLHCHDTLCHGGIPQRYTMKSRGSDKKLLRLSVIEALNIEKHPDELLMNERNEGGRGGIVRITASRVAS